MIKEYKGLKISFDCSGSGYPIPEFTFRRKGHSNGLLCCNILISQNLFFPQTILLWTRGLPGDRLKSPIMSFIQFTLFKRLSKIRGTTSVSSPMTRALPSNPSASMSLTIHMQMYFNQTMIHLAVRKAMSDTKTL